MDDESGIINCNLRKVKCNNVLNSNNKILEKFSFKKIFQVCKELSRKYQNMTINTIKVGGKK